MNPAGRQRGTSLLDDQRVKQALAPVGSEQWAEFCRRKLAEAIDREQRGLMEFSTEFETFFEHHGWRVLKDAEGEPFPDFRAFALAKRPHGLGCSEQRLKLLMVAIRKSAQEHGRAAPLKPVGAPVGNKNRSDSLEDKGSATTIEPRKQERGADYLAARLRRDAPDVADALAAGQFASVRAAARAAGIVRPPDPAKQAKTWLAKLPPEKAAEVAAPFAKPAPQAAPAPARPSVPRAPVTVLPTEPMAADPVDDLVERAKRLSAAEFARLMKRLRSMEQ